MKGIPNLFFTADQHFGHRLLIDKEKRGFASVEEMDETLIANHNAVVRAGDLVYSLGDLYMTTSVDRARSIQRRLNGNFYVLEGNHDKVARRLAEEGMFIWMRQLDNITVKGPWLEEKQLIILCHYAMRTWKNSCHGSWQLYGHSHGGLSDIPHCLAFDVGVDVPEWGLSPVSIEQVVRKMRGRIVAYQEWKASLGNPKYEG